MSCDLISMAPLVDDLELHNRFRQDVSTRGSTLIMAQILQSSSLRYTFESTVIMLKRVITLMLPVVASHLTWLFDVKLLFSKHIKKITNNSNSPIPSLVAWVSSYVQHTSKAFRGSLSESG